MKRTNKKGIGYVRKRRDTGKYFIDYYDHLAVRHREMIGSNKNDAEQELKKRIRDILTPPRNLRPHRWRSYVQGICR